MQFNFPIVDPIWQQIRQRFHIANIVASDFARNIHSALLEIGNDVRSILCGRFQNGQTTGECWSYDWFAKWLQNDNKSAKRCATHSNGWQIEGADGNSHGQTIQSNNEGTRSEQIPRRRSSERCILSIVSAANYVNCHRYNCGKSTRFGGAQFG